MPPSLGKPGGPGSPLCLWPGSGDGVVTQGTARKGSGTYGLWRDLLAAVQGMSPWQILSGSSGDTGLLGMGTSSTQPGLADRGSRLQPSTATGRNDKLGTRWGPAHQRLMCSAPRGAAFFWHQAELSWKAEHPQPQWGWGRGDVGICSCVSLSSHPRRISGGEEEGFFGTICWLCLSLPGAGTMCPAPSSAAVAGSGHAHAMQT